MRRSLRIALALAAGLSPNAALAQQGPPPVEVATPLTRQIVDYDVYTGRFEAVQEVEIRARVSGYLDAIEFADGAIVERGDLLFVVDQRPFRTAVNRAEAELRSARANRDLAEIEFRRAAQLAERNVGTAQEVDRTQAAFAQAEAQVAIAEAELDEAELNLAFTEIRAPIDGRMSDRKVDVGNLVIGGASNATLLSTVVSIDPIHFVFTASESDFLRYSRLAERGQRLSSRNAATPVGVRLMDEDGFPHQGTMNFVDNALDPNSGTIIGRAILPNPDGFLTPGVFGRLRLPGSGPYQALLIPDEAVLADQDRRIVMVVAEDGTVSQKPVEIGQLHRGMRVVRAGLEPSDRIVINGVQRARPGAKVTAEETELTLPEG